MNPLSICANPIYFAAIGGWKAIIQGDGGRIALLGMMVVFSGLIILTLVLYNLERVVKFFKNLDLFKSKEPAGEKFESVSDVSRMTGEEAAAICTAIILYHRMHMAERRQKLTMKQELKKLSPWALSGKIHRTGF